jgi:hypothetical protein
MKSISYSKIIFVLIVIVIILGIIMLILPGEDDKSGNTVNQDIRELIVVSPNNYLFGDNGIIVDPEKNTARYIEESHYPTTEDLNYISESLDIPVENIIIEEKEFKRVPNTNGDSTE